jgi:hypothetical protein
VNWSKGKKEKRLFMKKRIENVVNNVFYKRK